MKTYLVRFIFKKGNGYALVNTNKLSSINSILINQGGWQDLQIVDYKPLDICIPECGDQIITSGTISTSGSPIYIEGKSAFEIWKGLPGNIDKTLDDFFQDVRVDPTAYHGTYKLITIKNDTTVNETVENGNQLDIIYYNSTTSNKEVIIPASLYKTPDGIDNTLVVVPNGYVEINLLNLEGLIFARGG